MRATEAYVIDDVSGLPQDGFPLSWRVPIFPGRGHRTGRRGRSAPACIAGAFRASSSVGTFTNATPVLRPSGPFWMVTCPGGKAACSLALYRVCQEALSFGDGAGDVGPRSWRWRRRGCHALLSGVHPGPVAAPPAPRRRRHHPPSAVHSAAVCCISFATCNGGPCARVAPSLRKNSAYFTYLEGK